MNLAIVQTPLEDIYNVKTNLSLGALTAAVLGRLVEISREPAAAGESAWAVGAQLGRRPRRGTFESTERIAMRSLICWVG